MNTNESGILETRKEKWLNVPFWLLAVIIFGGAFSGLFLGFLASRFLPLSGIRNPKSAIASSSSEKSAPSAVDFVPNADILAAAKAAKPWIRGKRLDESKPETPDNLVIETDVEPIVAHVGDHWEIVFNLEARPDIRAGSTIGEKP